jgi:histone-lysine N-methyltransferase MLL3
MAEGGAASVPVSSVNRQSTLKMEADEALGSGATISSVLYANVNHPEWKKEFPGKLSNAMSRVLEKLLVTHCL